MSTLLEAKLAQLDSAADNLDAARRDIPVEVSAAIDRWEREIEILKKEIKSLADHTRNDRRGPKFWNRITLKWVKRTALDKAGLEEFLQSHGSSLTDFESTQGYWSILIKK